LKNHLSLRAYRRRRRWTALGIRRAPCSTPDSTRELTEIDAFSTSDDQNDASAFAGADDLGELTGSLPDSPPSGTLNRFHTIQADMVNASAANHVLCGVTVDCQVAAAADPGAVFHPHDPARTFDSRLAVLPESGRLGPNETKMIDITDGYDVPSVPSAPSNMAN
jgi:hypothetical protein